MITIVDMYVVTAKHWLAKACVEFGHEGEGCNKCKRCGVRVNPNTDEAIP